MLTESESIPFRPIDDRRLTTGRGKKKATWLNEDENGPDITRTIRNVFDNGCLSQRLSLPRPWFIQITDIEYNFPDDISEGEGFNVLRAES